MAFSTEFFDSYFGGTPPIAGAASLVLTDGTTRINLCDANRYNLLGSGSAWAMSVSGFKGGGVYTASPLSDGDVLKDGNFSNVTEALQVSLTFANVDNLRFDLEELTNLLGVKAPRYWQTRGRDYDPVYIEVQLPNELETFYGLISYGTITLPGNVFNDTLLNQGVIQPILVTFNRQPFFTKVAPGSVQGLIRQSSQQTWYFGSGLTTESSSPTGDVFCFVNDASADIYAGGASEILKYTGGSWGAATTTPITLSAEDITSAVRLTNDDILFGSNGRIIKLSAAGVWSEETTLPTGQVWALLEASTGDVYGADNGRILKRDTLGVWAENSTLPSGQVYSFAETSGGFVLAGEVGRILRTTEAVGLPADIEVRVEDGDHDGFERPDGTINDTTYVKLWKGTNRSLFGAFFNNVDIPNGATINSAVVEFVAMSTSTSTNLGTIKIALEDQDTGTPINDDNDNDLSNRTLTTAFTSWTDPESWTRNLKYDCPDFSASVQEVVDRAGWVSGNDMHVIFYDFPNQSKWRQAYTFDQDSSRAPLLKITYTEGVPTPTGWEVNSTLPTGDIRTIEVIGGTKLLAGDNGQILASQDQGDSWGVVSTVPTGQVYGLDVSAGSGVVYAGDVGNVYLSSDNGATFASFSTVPTGNVYAVTNLASKLRVGDTGVILHVDANEEEEIGVEATTTNAPMISNHHRESNLTHIYSDDGGAFTNLFPMSGFPVGLFPTVPAVNDALYFGSQTSIANTGPFSALAFLIGTAAESTTSYTIVWEYYNGASWASLTVNDETNQFSEVGVRVVAWELPSDWATVAVNAITGYWVRARLSALTGTLTVPTQITRSIYSPMLAFVEIDDGEMAGSIDAIMKTNLDNRSAGGGVGVSPELYANRVWVGAKSLDAHANFRAFLNFANNQNPDGITLDTSVDGDSATSIEADTGLSSIVAERCFFDASLSTLNTLDDRVAFKIATQTATDYYGTYLPFLRVKQTGGTAGDITVRIKVVFGSGGTSILGDRVKTLTTDDHHLMSFKQPVVLPLSQLVASDEVADDIQIVIQISSSSASSDLYLYDLFLLPTDTMYIDSADLGNNNNSVNGKGQRILLDSVTIPKTPLRTLVQQKASGLFSNTWRVDSRGPYELPTGTKLRLWMLAARTVSISDATLLSPPEIIHSVQSWKSERELI